MKRLLIAPFLLLTISGFGQETVTLDELMARFNWDLDAVEITTEKVDDGLFVLFGAGGNIAVSIGETGVLVVDDMFPELIPKVNSAIDELGGGPIDFAINTHWHFDHAHGNLALGPAGTWIVAHEQSSQMMAKDNVLNMVFAKLEQDAYPVEARPVISFKDRLRFHFNGGDIDLIHFNAAHTAGDAAVLFRKHNAVHFGDVFNNAGYPFVDVDSGGSVDGMIRFCEGILQELNEDSVVIPGHGPIVGVGELSAYIDMIKTVRDRVKVMIDEGMSVEEAIAAKPTAEFDEVYGDEALSLGFVNRVYTSLTRSSGR